MNQVEISRTIEDQLAPTPGLERFPDVVWCCTGRTLRGPGTEPLSERFIVCCPTPEDALRDAERPSKNWVWNGKPPTSYKLWEAMADADRDGIAGVRLRDGDGNILAEWRVGR